MADINAKAVKLATNIKKIFGELWT